MLYKLRLRWSTKYQPKISIALTSSFFASTFGIVTVRTPFSIVALIWSIFAFSGNLKLLKNLPLLRSTRCHVSFLSSFFIFLSPIIQTIMSSSTSIFTSSFLSPERSALNTWASRVSFQSIRVLTKAEVSARNWGTYRDEDEGNGKSLNGS